MSVYQLCPSPDKSTNEQNYAYWDNAFSESELTEIRRIGDSYIAAQATVNTTADTVTEIRRSQVSWLSCNSETQFIYDRLGYVARMMNGQFFDLDLYGFVEDLQYTTYNSVEEGHYDWHMDKGNLKIGRAHV